MAIESNNNNAPINRLTVFLFLFQTPSCVLYSPPLPSRPSLYPRTLFCTCGKPHGYIKTHGPEPIDLVNSITVVINIGCRRPLCRYTRKSFSFFFFFHTNLYHCDFSSFQATSFSIVPTMAIVDCGSQRAFRACPRAARTDNTPLRHINVCVVYLYMQLQ